MRRLAALALCAITLSLFVPATLQAQFRGRGGRSFDPAEMVRGIDANKNGQIEPAEMASNRSAFWVRGAAQRAGMDLSKPLPVDKLIEAMQRPRDERSRDGDRDRDRDDRRRDDDRQDNDRRPERNSPTTPTPSTPGVVGFGAPAASAPVASAPTTSSFGSNSLEQKYGSRVITYVDDMLERYDKNKDTHVDNEEWKSGTWSTPPEESDLNKDNRLSKEELCIRIAKRFGTYNPEGSSSASSSNSSSSDTVRAGAVGLMRQYDRNNDDKLEREEWMQMQPQYRTADTDSDGIITTDELAAKVAAYAGLPASSRGFGGGVTSSGTSSVRRFRTPAERLPAGLPSWFTEKDANEDGQVMMSEFAASWSDAKAAEFSRSDLNGDGIITAKECLKADSVR